MATLRIVVVNFLIFIVETLFPGLALIRVIQHFDFGPATRKPFSPITHMFLHGDIYRVTCNILCLMCKDWNVNLIRACSWEQAAH